MPEGSAKLAWADLRLVSKNLPVIICGINRDFAGGPFVVQVGCGARASGADGHSHEFAVWREGDRVDPAWLRKLGEPLLGADVVDQPSLPVPDWPMPTASRLPSFEKATHFPWLFKVHSATTGGAEPLGCFSQPVVKMKTSAVAAKKSRPTEKCRGIRGEIMICLTNVVLPARHKCQTPRLFPTICKKASVRSMLPPPRSVRQLWRLGLRITFGRWRNLSRNQGRAKPLPKTAFHCTSRMISATKCSCIQSTEMKRCVGE